MQDWCSLLTYNRTYTVCQQYVRYAITCHMSQHALYDLIFIQLIWLPLARAKTQVLIALLCDFLISVETVKACSSADQPNVHIAAQGHMVQLSILEQGGHDVLLTEALELSKSCDIVRRCGTDTYVSWEPCKIICVLCCWSCPCRLSVDGGILKKYPMQEATGCHWVKKLCVASTEVGVLHWFLSAAHKNEGYITGMQPLSSVPVSDRTKRAAQEVHMTAAVNLHVTDAVLKLLMKTWTVDWKHD